MQKKTLRIVGVTALAGGLMAGASPALAVTTVFNDGLGALPPGSQIIEDFNDGTSAFVVNSGTAGIYPAGGVTNIAADPAVGASDPFYAVLGGGLATYNFTNPLSQFSFILGSADVYNSLTVLLAGGGMTAFTGQQLIDSGVADGNQSSPRTNGRLIINGDGQLITGFQLASSENSFEIDDLAGVAAVPEPATWAMMFLGFSFMGAAMRNAKRKQKVTVRYT